jgi:hypothetical protein
MNPRAAPFLLWALLAWLQACASQAPPPPPPLTVEQVRQHADAFFLAMEREEPRHTPDQSLASEQTPDLHIPPGEVSQSSNVIRATGSASLARGLTLCQHAADLAARAELSKLRRVHVTEHATDRIRERSGSTADQDIEVIRETRVDESLRGVRIVDRRVDQAAGICSSTAEISKQGF